MNDLSFLITPLFWAFIPQTILIFFRVNVVADLFFGIRTKITKKLWIYTSLVATVYMAVRFATGFSAVTVPIGFVLTCAYAWILMRGRSFKEVMKVSVSTYVFMILLDMTAGFFPFFIKNRETVSVLINGYTFEAVAYSILGIGYIIKKLLIPKIKNINERQISVLSGISAAAYVVSTASVCMVFAYNAPSDERMYTILAFIFPSALAAVALAAINSYHTKALKRSLEENERYRENVEGLYETTRIFRHDYKNAMTVLMGYAREAKNEKIVSFLEQYNGEAEFADGVYVSGVSQIPDAGLKNLVISKLLAAQEWGIKTSFMLSDDLKNPAVSMKIYSELVGILFDNAIEASKGTRKAHINAELGNSVIHVANSVGGEVDINRIFERGYSTKNGHSGLGMYRFKHIVRKNNNMEYCVKSENGEFDFNVRIQEAGRGED